MKNENLFQLFQAIGNCANLKGVKFAYCLLKNNKLIRDEIAIIQATHQPTEKFQEYDFKRIELCKKYSKKDARNQPILENNNYVLENLENFDKDIKILQKSSDYENEIKNNIKKIEDYSAFLQEQCKVELIKIKFEDIPSDISVAQLDGIKELIEDFN